MVLVTLFGWFVLWPSLHAWVPAPNIVCKYFTGRISPGLDIRGGLRLTYDVEVEEAVRDRRNLRSDQLLRELGERLGVVPKGSSPTREKTAQIHERVKRQNEGERGIRLKFKSAADAEKLDHDLISKYGDLREVTRGDTDVLLEVKKDFLDQIRDTAVQQARETIQNRVDGLGMREASVTAQNTDIIVEVPGADQAVFDRIREIISKTARLEFEIVDDEATFVNGLTDLPEGVTKQTEFVSAGVSKPQVPSSYLLLKGKDARKRLTDYIEKLKSEGKVPDDHEFLIGEADRVADETAGANKAEAAFRTYYLFARAEVTGQAIEDAFVANDQQQGGKPYVAINFNSEGADLFKELTGRNIKRRMAIVLDDVVASAPVIQTEIGADATTSSRTIAIRRLMLRPVNSLKRSAPSLLKVDRDVRLAALLLIVGDERVFDRLAGDLGAREQIIRAERRFGLVRTGRLIGHAVGLTDREFVVVRDLAFTLQFLDVVGQPLARVFALEQQIARRHLRLTLSRPPRRTRFAWSRLLAGRSSRSRTWLRRRRSQTRGAPSC